MEALRVDEVEEEVSNGIGGLTTVTRKHLVFFDVEPTLPASPKEAFAAVTEIVTNWCNEHPNRLLAADRASLDTRAGRPRRPSGVEWAVASSRRRIGPLTLYHLVATETPHKSLAYPDGAETIEDSALQALWEISSPLLGRHRLAAEKPAVKPDSRGFVVNGKFDLLLDEVRTVLNG